MSTLGGRLGHRQWSGCGRWQGTQASTRSRDTGSSRLLGPRLNSQCTFLGAELKRPSGPAHLAGCKSGFFGVGLGPVATCQLALFRFIRGAHKCPFGTTHVVALVGAATEEIKVLERRPFEVADASRSALVQKVEATQALLRKDSTAEVEATPATSSSSADPAPRFEKDAGAEKSVKPAKKRTGSLLDSIRKKVLSTSEEAVAKAALEASPNAKKLVVRRMLKKQRTAVTESKTSSGLDADGARVDGHLSGLPRAVLRKVVNGSTSKGGPSWTGPEVGSVNGALWAVAAAASRIATGELESGVDTKQADGVRDGPGLENEEKRGVFGVDGACIEEEKQDGSTGDVQEATESSGDRAKGIRGGESVAGPSGKPRKTKSKRVEKIGGSGLSSQGSRGELPVQGAAFEEGVMDALRQAVDSKGPIWTEVHSGIVEMTKERTREPEGPETEEGESRKESGLSASTSGRDSASKPRRTKAIKVSSATESLIEKALSEDDAVAAPAPARRARKRVQKVVALEEAPGGKGDGQKPKRVRKRVRVRPSDAAADVDLEEDRKVDEKPGASAEGVSRGDKEENRKCVTIRPSVSGVPAKVGVLEEERKGGKQEEETAITEEPKGDSRRFKARQGKAPVSGPGVPVFRVETGDSCCPVESRAAEGSGVEKDVAGAKPFRSMIGADFPRPASTKRRPARTAVESPGNLGLAPKLATKSAGGRASSAFQGPFVDGAQVEVMGPAEERQGAKSGRLKVATGQVISGPIQAPGTFAPREVPGGSDTSSRGLKIASTRVGTGQGVLDNQDGRERSSKAARSRLGQGPASEDVGGPKLATMKVPMGPIEALRVAATRPVKELVEATAVEELFKGGPIQALRASGSPVFGAAARKVAVLNYLSDLEEEDSDDGQGFRSPPLAKVESAGTGSADTRSGSVLWGSAQPAAETSNYYTNSMLDIHTKTRVVSVKSDDSLGFGFDELDYMVETPEEESGPMDAETVAERWAGSQRGQRKRWKAQQAEEQLSSAPPAVTSSEPRSGDVLLGKVSWRDVSEGRLNPVGYEVVSAKNGGLIGSVVGLDPLKPEEEKEMEETGLWLHTSVLRVTAVDGFVDGFEREEEVGNGDSVEEDADESEGEWEDDGDVLANLDEMKAALGLSDSQQDVRGGGVAQQEFGIPVVKEYIANVSQRDRKIAVSLPGPLHRVSRRPAILRGLGMALYQYCSGKKRSVKMLVNENAGRGRVNEGRDHHRYGVVKHASTVHPQITYMPTEKELLTDGREDILEDILLVGGFAVATQALGLSPKKRPIGFWENKLHLDAEIELFNHSRWVERTDPETGAVFWVNLLNDMVSRTKPPPPDSLSPPLPVSYREEDVGTACMPKRKDVQEAGRWDLHHAIVSHGGYMAVSRELGRQSPLPRSAAVREQASKYAFPEMLVSAIRKVMKEKGLTKLPSIRDFEKMGRTDIVFGFRRHGGLLAVAELMKVEPKHDNVQWTLETAAAALNEYIEEKASATGQGRSMPTLKELQQAGKSNLRYVIQHFGQKVMAEQLGLPPNLSTHEKSRLRALQQKQREEKGREERKIRGGAGRPSVGQELLYRQ